MDLETASPPEELAAHEIEHADDESLEAITEPEEEDDLGDASTAGMKTRIVSCQN